MMKNVKRMVAFVVAMNLVFALSGSSVKAAYYEYHSSDKVYTVGQATKGMKHLMKGVNRKNRASQYQIVKIANGKVVLRPQQGYHQSEDPYFKKKTYTYKIAKNCKFYYTNVLFPYENGQLHFKRLSTATVKKLVRTSKIYRENIEGERSKFYTCGYFGDIYLKNGKVSAVMTNGGD